MTISNKILFILSTYAFLFGSLNAEEKTHFTIAIDPEYIPFSQKDIEGNPTGLLVDFWDLWAKKNGYTVEYKFYPWEETIVATKKGEVDFHSGTTQDRPWMYASNTIYKIRSAIFILRDTPLTKPNDLLKKRLGSIDSFYADQVKKSAGHEIQVQMYDDYSPMMEALKKGEIVAAVDDVEAVYYYLIKTGQMSSFDMIKDEKLQFNNDIYAITNKKNSVILNQINKGLEKLSLKDLVQIEKTWLLRKDEAYYTKKSKAQEQSYRVVIVGGLLGLLVLSSVYYLYMMRKKQQHTQNLVHKMEQLALTDDLTGLPNKRAFNQNFEANHNDKDLLGLLFIDVDYFKKYNDSYGHLLGDRALKKVANIIADSAKEEAFPYRIGGEEFGIILYNYDENKALKFAEEIRRKIVEHKLEHKDSPIKYITVSIGVSLMKPNTLRHFLFQCADQALYLAKKSGRNTTHYKACKN